MGARGNSGVILSQLLRGFARELDTILKHGCELYSTKHSRKAEIQRTKGLSGRLKGQFLTVSKDIASASEDLCEKTRQPS